MEVLQHVADKWGWFGKEVLVQAVENGNKEQIDFVANNLSLSSKISHLPKFVKSDYEGLNDSRVETAIVLGRVDILKEMVKSGFKFNIENLHMLPKNAEREVANIIVNNLSERLAINNPKNLRNISGDFERLAAHGKVAAVEAFNKELSKMTNLSPDDRDTIKKMRTDALFYGLAHGHPKITEMMIKQDPSLVKGIDKEGTSIKTVIKNYNSKSDEPERREGIVESLKLMFETKEGSEMLLKEREKILKVAKEEPNSQLVKMIEDRLEELDRQAGKIKQNSLGNSNMGNNMNAGNNNSYTNSASASATQSAGNKYTHQYVKLPPEIKSDVDGAVNNISGSINNDGKANANDMASRVNRGQNQQGKGGSGRSS